MLGVGLWSWFYSLSVVCHLQTKPKVCFFNNKILSPYIYREREREDICVIKQKKPNTFVTSDTICIQAWKIHVARKKTQGWLFSGKVQICGHTAWFALLYHVDIHARFHYWLDRFQLTEHDLAPSSAISYSNAQKSRTMCLVFFSFFLVFFPAKLLHESHKACVHKERQKKKGSSVLQLETVACSCCVVLCAA